MRESGHVARPLFLFAPGAGAPSTSAWMTAWKERLQTLGRVAPFDYPYMHENRRSPDPLPKLVRAHLEALEGAAKGHDGPVVLAGKSMGGRVGCHASLEATVSGLICFGYPLKAAGPRGAVRDKVLVALRTPVLFIQGTRDPLCPLELLGAVLPRMTAPNRLFIVEGGDHSLEVTATRLREKGTTRDALNAEILAEIGRFVAELG